MKAAKTINIIGGVIFCWVHLTLSINPEMYFESIYGMELATPGSKTVVRTLCLVLSTIGGLWTYVCIKHTNQRLYLKGTLMVAFSFVAGRVSGLLLDGYDQEFTYYELAFEAFYFFIALLIYIKTAEN